MFFAADRHLLHQFLHPRLLVPFLCPHHAHHGALEALRALTAPASDRLRLEKSWQKLNSLLTVSLGRQIAVGRGHDSHHLPLHPLAGLVTLAPALALHLTT